jgi:electron transfer flavoprotein-quinone oxidoreductase
MRAKDCTVVIVGCGAAGVTAAIGLARRKIPTIVVEGALYPGAENWSGAVYFCENLVRPEILGPKLMDQLAHERRVVRRGLLLSDGRVAVGGAVHSREAFEHCFTVLRPIFDHDLAQHARLLGAQILSDTTATALIRDGDRVLGVLTDRGPIYADLVFLAEGDASNLVTREGLETKPAGAHGLPEPEFLQGIKEVVALDPKVIESRFGVGPGEGACFEILLRNGSFGGRGVTLNAGGFLYTNRESVSLGIVAPLATLSQFPGAHNELMEWFKQLPAIAPLIAGGQTQSFGAKVIRGGGFKEMPRLVLDGLAVGGAAAGLGVDFPCPNYTGPATYCGFLISEAVHALIEQRKPFDAASLAERYVRPLEQSHYFADVKHLAAWPHFVATTREFFGRQVDLGAGSAHVLTSREFGAVERHFLFGRYVFDVMRGKWGALRKDLRAAQSALGADQGGVLRFLPVWLVNVFVGILPRRPRTESRFVPLFFTDGKTPRRPPPASVQFMRWRFRGSLADALFHLYRNDPVPLSEKVVRARAAVLSQLSILDFVILPVVFVFNWLVALVQQLFFGLWVKLAKPTVEKILATPLFRVREGARALGDYGAAPESMTHDAKLALITYRGEKKSHIGFHVAYDQAGLPEVASPVFQVCPAKVYQQDQDQSLAPSVAVLHENCVRCETCWRADPLHVDWGRTRGQRLVFEAYSSADAWLTESLEAAEDGTQPAAAETEPPASDPAAEARAPSPEVAALLARIRAASSGFRPLHERLPPVLLGGDQDLLDRVAGDGIAATEALEAALRPDATADLASRLSAMASWRALAGQHRAARRYFHLEADFDLLEAHHLPDLLRNAGLRAAAPAASPPGDPAKARADLRRELESRLTKEALHETEHGGAPSAAAAEAVRFALRALVSQNAAPPLPGAAARDLVLEELARLSPALAIVAAQHLAAVDLFTRFKVAGPPKDLEEVFLALARVRAFAAIADGPFTTDDDAVSGKIDAMPLGGVQILVLPLENEEIAVVGVSDPGVRIEAPGSLGLAGAGVARLVVDGAAPRARFGGVKARAWLAVRGHLDTVAVIRGAALYLRSRALDHAATRVQFPGLFRDLRGRDGVAKFGAVQAMLAEIEASTILLEAVRGRATHAAATAALAADLLGPGPRSVSYLAGQVLGGTAYSEEDPVCRAFRDAATLTRVPVEAEAVARVHGRRQLELARGSSGDPGQIFVGLDLKPTGFDARPEDPADLGALVASVREACGELKGVLASAPRAEIEGIAGDLGRLVLLGGAFACLVDAVRAGRARGDVDPRLEGACEHWSGRVAFRARRLAKRVADVPALVDLGRRLLQDGVLEGPAGAHGASYADFLDDAQPFTSGDLFAKPPAPDALAYSPELLEADLSLRHLDDTTRGTYRERWRDRTFDGLQYPRLLEKLHHVPLPDVEWLVTTGHFRQTIPAALGGQGRLKAHYYISCVNLMRHGDPAHALIVMGSTSIGTTPITIGLEQDLAVARGAIVALLAKPETVADVDARIARILEMSATAEALKIQKPFEELMGVVKKTLQSEKVLRLAFQGFLDAFMNAGRAGLKKDLPGMRKHLEEARARLAGWEARLAAERDALPHREAMHRFYLQQIAAGRISAFALTEPSAGSDTARIRTRARLAEVEATPDARGFYTFVPEGGSEKRNLFPIERLAFDGGRLVFVATDGGRHVVETRDFRYEPGDGPSKFRYVTFGGERVDLHDLGRVVARDGRWFYPYWRVDGAKMWITNGSVAGVMVLYARTDRGPTGFMMDAHQEGLSVGKDEAKMGQRGSTTNELALKDVRIPVDAVIGIEGRGQENALETLNVGRAGLSITACGLMHEVVCDVRASLAASGRPLAAEDLRELGKIALDVAGSESLAYLLCGRFDHHGTRSIRVESAIAKAETSEALHRVLRRAERLAGPSSVLAEGLLEKRRRDARVLTIYEGTNEVQRFLVLKDLIDVLPADLAPLEEASLASAPAVSAATASLSAARSAIMERVAALRKSLGSRAWQKVHLQPWLFHLVESYMAAVVLSATRSRVGLAVRLFEHAPSDHPRLQYLDRALALIARAVADLPATRLSAFDAGAARLAAGRDLLPQLLSDRALLAHEKQEAPAEPSLASRLARPVRALVVVDPAPAIAPRPRVRNDRLAEPLVELSPQDRAALALALSWRAAGLVHVSILGIGTHASSSVLREALALGADDAFLISSGPRPLLAGDVAEFAANLIRLEEELQGPYDVLLGADRSAGLLLPLARRLDLEPIPAVSGAAIEADADDLVISARLARPKTMVSVPGPALLLVAAEAPASRARFDVDGWKAARAKPLRVLDFVPRDAADGRLVVANGATADASASNAAGPEGPVDAAAAAKTFAEVAQVSAASSSPPRAFTAPIEDLTPDEFTARVAVVAVASMDPEAGPSPAAVAAIRAASALAARKNGRAGILLLCASEDEDAIRGFLAALFAQTGPVDVGIVGLEELPLLTERRTAALIESVLAGSRASTVYAADLRGAALMAAEGRIVAGDELPFMDGIDRVEADDGRVVLSGARLDGRARYVLARDAAKPFQVIARQDVAVEVDGGWPPSDSDRPLVALLSGVAPPEDFSDDLSRALREARSELQVASLSDADFIIDVGAGVGSRDGIEEAIDPLKAALERLGVKRVMIGASRKVTQDLGLLPDSCQIGQTGVSVNPRVLLAIGISGAPQHLNYIGDRGVIFAFNRDPEAPIMVLNRTRPKPRVFPVVGDLFEKVPEFIRALSAGAAEPAAPR